MPIYYHDKKIESLYAGGQKISVVYNANKVIYSALSRDDKTNAPGGKMLLQGDLQAGYYGEVASSELFTGPELARLCGVVGGAPINDTSTWFKFAWKNKTIFIARKPFLCAVSYNQLCGYKSNFGTIVEKNGTKYKVDLPEITNGSGYDVYSSENVKGCMVNKLLAPLLIYAKDGDWGDPILKSESVPDWGTHFNAESLGLPNVFFCEEKDSWKVPFCGGERLNLRDTATADDVFNELGWRPLLEVV